MTFTDTAAATAGPVANLTSAFMVDMATYQLGGGLGFEGVDFYVAGRGGVLGEVDADVVSAAFVFFNPDTVRTSWERSSSVMSRSAVADAFAGCGYEWGRTHLGDGPDYARVAELTGRVVAAASPAGAPVFAGWRHLPIPGDEKAAVIHHMNALRELRMARHACAVLAAGLTPEEAVMLRSPAMGPIFGWTAAPPDLDDRAAAWDTAEAATDVSFGRLLGVLDEREQAEFIDLLAQVTGAVV